MSPPAPRPPVSEPSELQPPQDKIDTPELVTVRVWVIARWLHEFRTWPDHFPLAGARLLKSILSPSDTQIMMNVQYIWSILDEDQGLGAQGLLYVVDRRRKCAQEGEQIGTLWNLADWAAPWKDLSGRLAASVLRSAGITW